MSNHMFDEQVGLLKSATIVGYDDQTRTIKAKLNTGSSFQGKGFTIDVPAPHSLFYNNGLFVGSLPMPGTPIVVGQGSGGQYYFSSFLSTDVTTSPELTLGELLIQAGADTKITLDLNNDIFIGSNNNNIHVNTAQKLITFNFDSENHFTQGQRSVNGLIKRDLNYNTNYANKLESDSYEEQFSIISLDPYSSPNAAEAAARKNPPFIEKRSLIYEFQYSSNVGDDLFESSIYGNSLNKKKNYTFPNRRESRADTLSLSLVAPNFLIETVQGTVVDIFGNILDLNRMPLPVGQGDNTLRSDKSADKVKSFLAIKEIERKSLAYHFEINARKDLTNKNGKVSLPDVNSSDDYARARSRFFIDIDKEGQFKINVPASSEKGNVPLLTRYENYSTFGLEDDGNPNKLIYRDDNLDIFPDSFASGAVSFTGDSPLPDKTNRGSISLKNGDANASPLDRLLNTHIKHGVPYHDILQTCYAHQTKDFLDFQTDDEATRSVDIDSIPLLTNIVSDIIKTGGDDANAGGRSGSINFDGSIDLIIGANTVDRQSMWLDTAGGIVANIGRDKNNRSSAISMNGDVYMQIGGIGVSGDSRFQDVNGQIGAVFDLRVFTDGLYTHMIRIDKNGVTVLSPGNINIHSKGNMRLTAGTDLVLEGETVTIQNRMVLKEFGGSI